MAAFEQLLFVATCFLVTFAVERHTIKIVEEPSSYGLMNNFQGGGPSYGATVPKLKMRVTPSNFSGPTLFRRLVGKCFSKIDESYKYEFCPFSNVTQHEQSLRWNPYSGILGVWQEWEIINNTFIAMVMREGDKCGNHQRTTKVHFVCGKENKVVNMSEPSTCNYHMNFTTPYVCHKHAMLVYPTLSKQLQTEWNLLEGELSRKEITMKGYNKYLSRIFVKAGYMMSEEKKKIVSDQADDAEKKVQKEADGQFDNLYTCTEEYRKLKKEVDDLKALVELQGQNHVADPHEIEHGYLMDD